ncbi:hypothetical protein PENSPDRAFT_691465 [Peniophora sp. CONT]|nr:hypothetical protein PENSPDRAFT_691465 [Peniophora sp. CONT]
MARTRYLYLSCEPCNMHLDLTTRPDWPALYEHAQDLMRRLMETPAPLLEVLDLRMINVPKDIFTGIAPTSLRSVHLLDCNPVPRMSSFFSSPLTGLVMDYCNSWDTVDDMLSALAALPHLRWLQWDTDRHSDHPPFHHPEAHERKSLPLHHLEHLELSSSLDNVSSIVHILDFPPTATLIISGELLQEPVIGTQSFDDLCKRISQDLEPHLRRSFVDEATGFTSLVNHAYRGHNEDGFSFSWSHPSGDGPFPTSFEFGVFWDMENRGEYLAILQLMLSWPGMRHALTRLVVDHEIFMAQESHSWSTVFRTLPNLTNVDVHGASAICMLRAVRTSASSPHPSERYITSNLRTVRFIDVGPEFFPELLGMLSERRALSLPPLEIKLRGCEVDTESVTRLRRCQGAKSVEWDEWKKEEVSTISVYEEQLAYVSDPE